MNADLILHPVRYQILQSLYESRKTTQEIAEDMPSTPKSSIYRHLKVLLEAGLVQIVEIRQVNGIQEKVYQAGELPRVKNEDMEGHTIDDYKRMAGAYFSAILKGFTEYLDRTPQPDLLKDKVGFTDTRFYASDEELENFRKQLNEILQPLMNNLPDKNKRRHMVSMITYPLRQKDE
jgi:DNA-binding transcriptional ArsR family regulator